MSIDVCPSALSGVPADLFLTLLNALLASKCKFDTKEEYPRDFGPNIADGDEFDFIVIGSGSAGSVVAHQLAKNPKWKILVLEAGGVPSSNSEVPTLLFCTQQTKEDWQYTIEKNSNASLSIKDKRGRWPRGKLLGGCSSINAMLYVRGNKKDFDQWGEIAEGWDYESVLPYFKMVENYQDPRNNGEFGINGLQPLQNYNLSEPIKEVLFKAAEKMGIPTYPHEPSTGVGYFTSLFAANGTRQNTAKVFLTKNQGNLKVSHNSFVEKLIIDPDTKKVTGVLVKIGDRQVTLKVGKEAIVSAGAINSPQLLLLSGIGPKEHLESFAIPLIADLPVGKNLQDHLFFWGFAVKVDDSIKNPINLMDELYQYFMYQKGQLSNVGLLTTMGFINTRNDSPYPNMQFHHHLAEKNDMIIKTTARAADFEDDFTTSLISSNQNDTMFLILPTLLNPKSRGEILLKSQNPYDHPLIYANYLQDPDDLEVMLEGVRFAEKLLETEMFRKLNPEIKDFGLKNCKKYKFRSDDYWKCYIRNVAVTVWHPAGTCALGSVVDSRLKVKGGVKNLRVIDASVMPFITSGNTHAPSMMIGQKGGVMIMEDWGVKYDEL